MYVQSCVLCSIIHNSQHMETTQVSFNEKMGKEDVIDTYLYNGILFGHERELFVTTWMDLEGLMLSEISQTEPTKYSMGLLVT